MITSPINYGTIILSQDMGEYCQILKNIFGITSTYCTILDVVINTIATMNLTTIVSPIIRGSAKGGGEGKGGLEPPPYPIRASLQLQEECSFTGPVRQPCMRLFLRFLYVGLYEIS